MMSFLMVIMIFTIPTLCFYFTVRRETELVQAIPMFEPSEAEETSRPISARAIPIIWLSTLAGIVFAQFHHAGITTDHPRFFTTAIPGISQYRPTADITR